MDEFESRLRQLWDGPGGGEQGMFVVHTKASLWTQIRFLPFIHPPNVPLRFISFNRMTGVVIFELPGSNTVVRDIKKWSAYTNEELVELKAARDASLVKSKTTTIMPTVKEPVKPDSFLEKVKNLWPFGKKKHND